MHTPCEHQLKCRVPHMFCVHGNHLSQSEGTPFRAAPAVCRMIAGSPARERVQNFYLRPFQVTSAGMSRVPTRKVL